MKKILSFLFVLVLVFSVICPGVSAAISAAPTAPNVLVNGQSISFEAYKINGNNYLKLRDLAKALNGTEKQFEVGWDGANDAISLTTGQPYTTVGGELTSSGLTGVQSATLSTAKVLINGVQANLTAYRIGDNNYFMLREVGAALDFSVDWNSSANTITIDTAIGYSAEVQESPSPSPSPRLTTGNLKVSISATCSGYNHVGNEWGQGFLINGQDISSGQVIKVNLNDVLKIQTTVEEFDSVPDIGTASSNVTITADYLKNGFTVKHTVNVRENRGRYSGNVATWTVTYTFAPN